MPNPIKRNFFIKFLIDKKPLKSLLHLKILSRLKSHLNLVLPKKKLSYLKNYLKKNKLLILKINQKIN